MLSYLILKKKKTIFVAQLSHVLLNQTYKKFEIIIIYDDEKKKDLFLIKNIQKKDRRIKLILNKKNIGLQVNLEIKE